MSDGSERVADHLLFATGYRIDIAKYPFLDPLLLNDIDRVNGYPRLKLDRNRRCLDFIFSGRRPPGASVPWPDLCLELIIVSKPLLEGSRPKANNATESNPATAG